MVPRGSGPERQRGIAGGMIGGNGQGTAVQVRRGAVWRGQARRGGHGAVWRGTVWLGLAVKVWLGKAWRGMAWLGLAVEARPGKDWPGWARQGWAVKVVAMRGWDLQTSPHGDMVKVRRSWIGEARQGEAGRSRLGMDW